MSDMHTEKTRAVQLSSDPRFLINGLRGLGRSGAGEADGGLLSEGE